MLFLWSSHIELSDFENDGNNLALMGRLRPGVTSAQAQAEAGLLFPKLDHNLRLPSWTGGHQGRLLGLKDYVSGKLRLPLIVLWCAVGMILLIVCVNLSNLLLARSAARSKEFAMRSSQGAGRGRLVRQLLTDSLILSGTAAILRPLSRHLCGFGATAGSLGIYGVISYLVTQQTQEIGIRMALGASRFRVQGTVIWKTLRLALLGMLVGMAASFFMAQVIATLLFGTAPTDPIPFAGTLLILSIVALVAGYLPSRLASKIDPMIALRNN